MGRIFQDLATFTACGNTRLATALHYKKKSASLVWRNQRRTFLSDHYPSVLISLSTSFSGFGFSISYFVQYTIRGDWITRAQPSVKGSAATVRPRAEGFFGFFLFSVPRFLELRLSRRA